MMMMSELWMMNEDHLEKRRWYFEPSCRQHMLCQVVALPKLTSYSSAHAVDSTVSAAILCLKAFSSLNTDTERMLLRLSKTGADSLVRFLPHELVDRSELLMFLPTFHTVSTHSFESKVTGASSRKGY